VNGGSRTGRSVQQASSEPTEARAYVRYLDAVGAFDQTRGYKRRALELLEVAPGQRVLDVGCGTGDEVRVLAGRTGPAGQAVGLDRRAGTVAEAHRRAAREGSRAAFVAGDAARLPFPDAGFDRCRTDRVLQHLAAPAGVVAELGRVTAPRGRVVLTEPDWETAVVDAPDAAVTRRIAAARRDRFPSGGIGRQLPRLLHAAGLEPVAVVPHTATLRRLAEADPVCLLRASAAHAATVGAISPAERDAWITALEAADQAGHFFASVTLFTAAGRKP
jgi:ubiquinone/menaquinone biosynthesis C-methylase UbiE